MKTLLLICLTIFISMSHASYAGAPTETLKVAVDKLLAVAADKTSEEQNKKNNLKLILSEEIDFESVSKRVVSKTWKKATAEQKEIFKKLFLEVMSDTYFVLLNNYTNEQVLFLKEQLKSTKKNEYAIVDTQIISGNKKIPVRYRMVKLGDVWKIYDFVPEGISLITTYKNNYSTILKKKGMQGLLDEMASKKSKESEE